MNDYLRLVSHVASEGGYLSVCPRRLAPSEWKATVHLEDAVHTVLGPTVDDVVTQLADRVGALD